MRFSAVVGTWAIAALALVGLLGCGGDDDDDDDSGGQELLSGTACTTPVSFDLAGDERILVQEDGDGLGGIYLLDGEGFDTEDEAAWTAYADSGADVILVINFEQTEPATPHTIDAIFDSLFGARDVGVMGFKEHREGEQVTIVAIDPAAQTIEVDFEIPVYAFTDAYPPGWDTLDECNQGSVSGHIEGTYETMM